MSSLVLLLSALTLCVGETGRLAAPGGGGSAQEVGCGPHPTSGVLGLGGETYRRYFDAARKVYQRIDLPTDATSVMETFRFHGAESNDLPRVALTEGVLPTMPILARIPGLRNVRDIGGWTGLRTGRVYRGGALCWTNGVPPTCGAATTAALTEVLRLRTDLDLRGKDERRQTRDGHPRVNFRDVGVPNLVEVPLGGYLAAFTSTNAYRTALRTFADARNYPIYVHCAGGADRTGTVVFILEALCGVSDANLAIDYELTTFAKDVYGSRRRNDEGELNFKTMVDRFRADYPGATLAEKVEVYARLTLGLTAAEIAAIRANLTVGVGETGRLAAPGAGALVQEVGCGPHPTTVIPVPRLKEDTWGWWRRCGEKYNETLKGETYDLVFVGDSITQFWERPDTGLPVYENLRKTYRILNLGFAGDCTENVLWRFREARHLQRFKAKLFMVMIGTNNINSTPSPPEEVRSGVAAIVEEIRKAHPEAKILLLPIFENGRAGTVPNPDGRRARTNPLLEKLAHEKGLLWVDFNDRFLDADGKILDGVFSDGLHLSTRGYEIWREAVEPVFARVCAANMNESKED